MSRRGEDRKASYKKSLCIDAARRKREDTLIQIRKAKQEERLLKRRTNVALEQQPPDTNANSAATTMLKKVPTLAELPQIVQCLQNPNCDATVRMTVVRDLRRMVSVENAPIQQVISAGLLHYVIRLLAHDDDPMLQLEAAWTLTNVASTDFTYAVVDAGCIPGLVRLLECPTPEVREQVSWCLGNIAGDCPDYRDMVLHAGALSSLLKNIASWDSNSLVANVVWTISNLCRGKPASDLALLQDSIPALAYVISNPQSWTAMIVDAVWALSYLSEGDDERIQAVMDTVPILVPLLQTNASTFIVPALRALGNIVTGNEKQTQAVLDAGFLDSALELLQSPRKRTQKEICWVLSNIAAGTQEQIDMLFKKANVVPALVNCSRFSPYAIRKEAIWAVSNIFTGGSKMHVQKLVHCEAVESMCDALDLNDANILFCVLNAIEHLLRLGEANGRDYVSLIDECEGIDKLEKLQHHVNEQVYEKVVKLIDEFFGEKDHEDENLVPATDGNAFVFGLTSTSKNLFASPDSGPGSVQSLKFDFRGGANPFGSPQSGRSSVQSPGFGGKSPFSGFNNS